MIHCNVTGSEGLVVIGPVRTFGQAPLPRPNPAGSPVALFLFGDPVR